MCWYDPRAPPSSERSSIPLGWGVMYSQRRIARGSKRCRAASLQAPEDRAPVCRRCFDRLSFARNGRLQRGSLFSSGGALSVCKASDLQRSPASKNASDSPSKRRCAPTRFVRISAASWRVRYDRSVIAWFVSEQPRLPFSGSGSRRELSGGRGLGIASESRSSACWIEDSRF